MATTPYPYGELDLAQDSIRLLRIQKGWPIDDVVCQLFESYPDQERGPAYKALSYTWGGLEHKCPGGMSRVLVDGHHIKITENLYAALQQIRRHDYDTTLWVDAICINQGDNAEKGHQVNQMGNIYRGAEEVLIWLGPSNDDIDALLQHISWIDDQATQAQALGSTEDWTTLCRRALSQQQFDLGRGTQALADLLARPWFTRAWILQEVASAKTARIMCGSSSCAARTFALMPQLLGGVNVDDHTQAILDIMPRVRRNTWWSSDRCLHSLLTKFENSQARLPRDKIYALLGMSEDACNPASFYPCYKKSDSQVFRDTASFLLFGEVLDSSYALPKFTLSELARPIIQLAEKALSWSLMQNYPSHRESARKTVELLLGRVNEGRLKAASLVLHMVEVHASRQVEAVQDIVSQEIELSAHYWGTLTVTSKHQTPVPPVILVFDSFDDKIGTIVPLLEAVPLLQAGASNNEVRPPGMPPLWQAQPRTSFRWLDRALSTR